jgi:hypothetical protein
MHDKSVLLHLLCVLMAGGLTGGTCFGIGERVRKCREHRRARLAAAVPADGEPLDDREQEIFNGYVIAESRRDPFAYDPMKGRVL